MDLKEKNKVGKGGKKDTREGWVEILEEWNENRRGRRRKARKDRKKPKGKDERMNEFWKEVGREGREGIRVRKEVGRERGKE